MTPCSLTTCEVSAESQSATSPMSTCPSPLASGCGSRPLTATNRGMSPKHLTARGSMSCRSSLRPSGFSDPHHNSPPCFTHITSWTSLMETPPHSFQEVERLKSANATLLARIRTLEAEIQRIRAKIVNTWGDG